MGGKNIAKKILLMAFIVLSLLQASYAARCDDISCSSQGKTCIVSKGNAKCVDYCKTEDNKVAAPANACSVKREYCNPSTLELEGRCNICGCNKGEECKSDGRCVKVCTDGTEGGTCSSQKPLFCNNGALEQKSQICGCDIGKEPYPDGTCAKTGFVEDTRKEDFADGDVGLELASIKVDQNSNLIEQTDFIKKHRRADIIERGIEDLAQQGDPFASSTYPGHPNLSYKPSPICVKSLLLFCDWISGTNESKHQNQYIGIKWQSPQTFGTVSFAQSYLHAKSYKIQYLKDGSWVDATKEKLLNYYPKDYSADLGNFGEKQGIRVIETASFEPVTSTAMRIFFPECNLNCRVARVNVYNRDADELRFTPFMGYLDAGWRLPYGHAAFISKVHDTENAETRFDSISMSYRAVNLPKSKSVNIAPEGKPITSDFDLENAKQLSDDKLLGLPTINDKELTFKGVASGIPFYWLVAGTLGDGWAGIEWNTSRKINKVNIYTATPTLPCKSFYDVEYWDGSKWKRAARGYNKAGNDYFDMECEFDTNVVSTYVVSEVFDAVITTKIRIKPQSWLYIAEIEAFEPDEPVNEPKAEASVKTQIRTAPSKNGKIGAWTNWMGPDGTDKTYFTKQNEKISIKILNQHTAGFASPSGTGSKFNAWSNPENAYQSDGKFTSRSFSFANLFSKSEGDSIIWTMLNPKSEWGARYLHKTLAFNDKIWVFGGYSPGAFLYGWANDVWSSSDGIKWVKTSPRDAITGMLMETYAMTTLAYNGKMWFLGGNNVNFMPPRSAVFSSSDGKAWTEEIRQAAWYPRWSHSSVVHDNKMWVIGGYTVYPFGLCYISCYKHYYVPESYLNDVWYSADGKNWVAATRNASWAGRYQHASVAFDGKIWVLGGISYKYGIMNDVWYSEDGANWKLATEHAPWNPRGNFEAVVYDDKMWVFGGYGTPDAWFSKDGVNWIRATPNSLPLQRQGHSAVVFKNKIYFTGGTRDSSYFNDVWTSDLIGCQANVYISPDKGQALAKIGSAVMEEKETVKTISRDAGKFGWKSEGFSDENLRVVIMPGNDTVNAQDYYGFNLNVPEGAEISEVTVNLEGKCRDIFPNLDSIQLKVGYVLKNDSRPLTGRYVQFKAILNSSSENAAAALDKIRITYPTSNNLKPTVAAKNIESLVNAPINFTANAQDADGTIVKYEWNFGDGNIGFGKNVLHAYNDSGIYDAELIVIDDGELSSSAKFKVYINAYNCLQEDDYDATKGNGPNYFMFTPSDPLIRQKATEAILEYAQEKGLKAEDIDTSIEFFEAANKYITTHMSYSAIGENQGINSGWDGESAPAKRLFADSAKPESQGGKGCANDYCGDCEDFAHTTEALVRAMGVSPKCAYASCSSGKGAHCWNIFNIAGKFRLVEPQSGSIFAKFDSNAYNWKIEGDSVYSSTGVYNDELGRFFSTNNADPAQYTLNYPGPNGLPNPAKKCLSYAVWKGEGDKTYFTDICK